MVTTVKRGGLADVASKASTKDIRREAFCLPSECSQADDALVEEERKSRASEGLAQERLEEYSVVAAIKCASSFDFLDLPLSALVPPDRTTSPS